VTGPLLDLTTDGACYQCGRRLFEFWHQDDQGRRYCCFECLRAQLEKQWETSGQT